MSKQLPARPSLEHLKKQAKDLLSALEGADPSAIETVRRYFPSQHSVGLNDAQLVVAREYGFESWPKLKDHVEAIHRTSVEDQFFTAVQESRIDEARQLWAEHQDAIRGDLKCALRAGDREAVEAACQAHPGLINESLPPYDQPALSYISFSPLLKAPEFEAGLLSTARYLLSSGADPNGSTQRDWGVETVLFGASGYSNNPRLTKMLLDAGASPNDGESLYHSSEHDGDNECVRYLLEAKPSQDEMNWCMKRKLDFEDPEGLKLYLDHGANPNRTNPRTALSHAVLRRRSPEILGMLVDAGADPNVPDEDGIAPYGMARRIGNREAAQFLLDHGARPDLGPEDAILAAAVDGNLGLLRDLIEKHPDVVQEISERSKQPGDGFPGSSPMTLHEMARYGHLEVVRALLDIGMKPDFRNEWDQTPLHWASIAARTEVARLLLDRGAVLNVYDAEHHSDPLGWALWGSSNWNDDHGDYAATVRLLIERGALVPEHYMGSPEVNEVLQAFRS